MADENTEKMEAKSRKCTVSLTPAAAAEVDRMCEMFGLKTVDLFRYALLLMRIYTDAITEGKQVRLVNRKDPTEVQVVELPLFIEAPPREGKSERGAKSNAVGVR